MTGQFFWSILPMLGNKTKTKTVARYHDPVPGRPNKVQPDGPCMRDTLFTEEQLDEIDRRLAIKIREFYGREKKLKEATRRYSEELATRDALGKAERKGRQIPDMVGDHPGECVRINGICPACCQRPTC